MPRKRTYTYSSRSKTNSKLLLFPLFLIVTILPLLVSMHTYNTGLNQFDWYPIEDTAVDTFLYYKQWFFVLISSVCALILIVRGIIDKKEIKFIKIFIPLALYAVLALISTLTSPYRIYGFTGMFEQFENVFCLLGYALIVYYAFSIIQSEYELQLFINALAIGALILGLIGTLQAIGYDIFTTSWGKALIAEKDINPNSLELVFGKKRTYATLYNPNYVGVYTSMIIPLYTALLFYTKFSYEYVLYLLVILSNLISMFGSQSKSGIVSIVASMLIVLLIMRKKILKRWFIILPIIASICIAFLGINYIQQNAYIKAIIHAFKTVSPATPALTEIATEKEYIKVVYNNSTLYVSQDNRSILSFCDSSMNAIPYHEKEAEDSQSTLVLEDERFSDITPITYDDEIVDFGLSIQGKLWYFSYDEETEQYRHYNRYGRFSPIATAPSAVFTGYENFASKRGYLWSRTIPLLSNYIFLGSGADTFAIAFPQYDFVNAYNFGYESELITKPHSLYLQIGVQTGIISLIALLVFYSWYFIQSIKLYINHSLHTKSSIYGMALFISSISFMISAISNDSSISVSPVFWCCIGAGLAANMVVKKHINK